MKYGKIMTKSKKERYEIINEDYVEVPIDKVHPNTYNNNILDDKKFDILVSHIEKNGFNQPIIVVYNEKTGDYTIVDGEHRYLACKKLNYTTITVKVLTIDDMHKRLMTLSFNKLRGEEDPGKTSILMNELMSVYNLKQDEISDETGYNYYEMLLYTSNLEKELEESVKDTNRRLYEYSDIDYSSEIYDEVQYGEIWKLGSHIVIVADPRSKTDINSVIGDNIINLFMMDVPTEYVGSDDIEKIHLWLKPLFENILNKMGNDSSLLIKTRNLYNKFKNKSIYDYLLIKLLLNNYSLNFKDSIIIIRDDIIESNMKSGYVTYNHFTIIREDYKYFPLDILNMDCGKLDSYISRKGDVGNPYNIFFDSNRIDSSANIAMITLFTDENDIIFEPYVRNSKNILCCESCNRRYIGMPTSPSVAASLINNWEDYSTEKAKCIKRLRD